MGRRTKIILYTSKKLKDESHPLMLRVTADNDRKYFATGLRCKPEHWNAGDEVPNEKYTARVYEGRTSKAKLLNELALIKSKAERVVNELRQSGNENWKVSDFATLYRQKGRKPLTVLKYFDKRIRDLNKAKHIGNSATYANTKRIFEKYLKSIKDKPDSVLIIKKDLYFTDITTAFLRRFVEYCEGRGNKPGTISIYLRTLRAIYNRAIEDGEAIRDKYPFRSGTIPKGQPLKRALSEDEFLKFKTKELEDKELEQSRDYFLFSFYARGMNFFDLARLKLKNIKANRIEYTRAKTGGLFKIGISSQLREIIDKYSKGKVKDEYLFPIINPKYTELISLYNRIQKIRVRVNQNLKIIAKLAGIDSESFTFYSARHSFATILKYRGASTVAIQEMLGHKDVKTTETYLKSFGDPVLDKLIEQTIDF